MVCNGEKHILFSLSKKQVWSQPLAWNHRCLPVNLLSGID